MLCCVQEGLWLAADSYRAEHQVASSKLKNVNSVAILKLGRGVWW